MADVKSLSDYYNPAQTMQMALMYQQGQQHIALQQQSIAQQGANLEIDNLQKALTTANPMESYPIYKSLMTKLGQPVPSVNEYYANTPMYNNLLNAEPGSPEHNAAMAQWQKTSAASRAVVKSTTDDLRAFRGAQEANIKAGLGGSENLAALTQEKPAFQTQVGQAAAQTPMEQAKAQALQNALQEHENVTANVNTQLGALVPIAKAGDLAIQRVAPHVAELATMQQAYDKTAKSAGIVKAGQMRQDQMALSPDLKAFNDRRQQSIPALQNQVQQIEDLQNQLQTRAELIANGVQPLQDGESLHVLAGKIDASVKHLDYARATLAFAKDPSPANLEALKAQKTNIDTHIQALTEKKNQSQDMLSIRRDAQQETARKNQAGEKLDAATAKGQALLLDAVNNGEKADVAAARIAKTLQVSPFDLKKALTDPNKPQTQVNLTQEKKEAQTVGEGFGQQYLDTQKAGRTASYQLSKLDRMDTLMAGVSTGKLTPALTEVQAIGQALGIKVDPSLGAKQAFTAMAGEMALQLRNPAGGAGMPGAMSDKDREFLQSMTPSLAQTNDGNRIIIDTARKVAQRDQQIAKMARDYRKANGSLDEGFYEAVQNYGDAHPLFTGKTLPGAQAPAVGGVAPFTDPSKEQRYQDYKKGLKK